MDLVKKRQCLELSKNVRTLILQSNTFAVQPRGFLHSFVWNLWHRIVYVPYSIFLSLRKLCSIVRYKVGYYVDLYYRKGDLRVVHGKICLDLFNGASNRLLNAEPVIDPLLLRFKQILKDPFHGSVVDQLKFTASYVRLPRDVLQIYTEKDPKALYRIEQRFNVKFLHGRDFERGRDPVRPNAPRGIIRITIHGSYDKVFEAKNELYSWIFQQGDYQEEQILVPEHAVGNVIGKAGSRVNLIRQQSKAKIDFEPRDNRRDKNGSSNNRNNAQSFVKVVVSGRRPARTIAKERIQDCVDYSERMREKDRRRDAIRDVRRRIMYGASDEDSDDDYDDYDDEPSETTCSVRVADTMPSAIQEINQSTNLNSVQNGSNNTDSKAKENIPNINLKTETNTDTRISFGRSNNNNNQNSHTNTLSMAPQLKPRSVLIAEAKAAEQKRTQSVEKLGERLAVGDSSNNVTDKNGIAINHWPERPAEEQKVSVALEFASSSGEDEEPTTWDPNAPSWESRYLGVDES